MRFSTIAAISTPRGKGGVALLRVSGPDAMTVAERVFHPAGDRTIRSYPARHQIYGNILSFEDQTVLDDGLLTYFTAPHSFTGEDVVEICSHGGEVVSALVLSSLLSAGAVMAQPGEFTRRAFINGKITLSAAEGVADLLDAKTETAAVLSAKAARGSLSDKISALSKEILALSASLWAYLDYPEEDLQTFSDEEMLDRLAQLDTSCEKLLCGFRTGRAVTGGVPAVILGKPNVGKSTFFNALCGEERAIVTDIPGTTRDVLEIPVKAGRILLQLFDTAGIRGDTDDTVEKIGIDRAFSYAKTAQVVFVLFDASRPLDDNDLAVYKEVQAIRPPLVIPVFNKSDLAKKIDASRLFFDDAPVMLSAVQNPDFSEIIRRLESFFITDEDAFASGEILFNERQKACLVKCRQSLAEAKEQIASGMKDIASLTLENALAFLLEIDGEKAGETILNEVFSRFCIGK